MAATAAPCCKLALKQASERWPNRNRAYDGIMGDAAHQKRKSDHNDGNAFDLSHDPIHGVDCAVLSREVVKDKRVTYVIFNREIYNRERATEGWRKYNGPSPHDHHMHVSIKATSRNDLADWPWAANGTSKVQPQTTSYPGHPVRLGDLGESVYKVQKQLIEHGYPVACDKHFGPKTQRAVIAFQKNKALFPDGIVGPKTWAALMAPRGPANPAGLPT
jgi:Putative peptidoglycan binding domain